MDEGEHLETVSSPVTEAATEIVLEMPLSDPQDVASSLGATLEPSTSSPADIPGFATVLILSVAAIEIAEEDISLGPITGPHAALV